jgi:hypothetical protein
LTDFRDISTHAVSQAGVADSTGASQSAEQDQQILLRNVWQLVSQREWAWRTLFYLLLAAPLLVSGPLPGFELPLNLVWPRIHSGDEPHYLIILNSLIRDGDMDLANNYASVHAGGTDAGLSFAGQALDS